ncbi:MAG: hypothetical protein AAB932_01975 [Patescibacteria group bacterium]
MPQHAKVEIESPRVEKKHEKTRGEQAEIADRVSMIANRDALTGRLWTRLLNGQQADIIWLSRPDMLRGFDLKLRDVERDVSRTAGERIEQGDYAAVDDVAEQIDEGKVEGELMRELITIFRAYGEEIYMLHEERDQKGSVEDEGLDTAKMGNRVDFDKGPVFVIAASRSDEMKELFKNPPAESGFSPREAFDIEPWNYLGTEGFIVKFRHPDGSGEMTEMRFLYAEDTKVRSLAGKREEKKN